MLKKQFSHLSSTILKINLSKLVIKIKSVFPHNSYFFKLRTIFFNNGPNPVPLINNA